MSSKEVRSDYRRNVLVDDFIDKAGYSEEEAIVAANNVIQYDLDPDQ